MTTTTLRPVALHAVPDRVDAVQLLDASDVANLLRCSERKARRLMAPGGPLHTVPIQDGGQRGRRVRVDDFNAYVDSLDDR